MSPLRPALVALAVTLSALALAAGAERAPAQLQTGFNGFPTTAFEGAEAEHGFALVRDAGATVVKVHLDWAVAGKVQPAAPTDPCSAEYDWAHMDDLARDAKTGGVELLVAIIRTPPWAAAGKTTDQHWDEPDPVELGRFARAAAERYRGDFDPAIACAPPREPDAEPPVADPLPRIRLWQVWNEPNLAFFLKPQRNAQGVLVAPARYRAMVNRVSAGVKAVRATNLVVAGGTGPFRRTNNTAPFAFLRNFLCLKTDLTPVKGCGPARFDAWGHHPYTSGSPLRKAASKNDASLGDLPRMRQVLNAGVRHGKVDSRGKLRFWVDEFSWDTNPPDPGGVPASLHRRWTAEGLYRMWSAGVTLVAWLQLADNRWTPACSPGHNPYQSGLYHWAATIDKARPKSSLAAFRFPFVVLRSGTRVVIWGRTPSSTAGGVVVQRKTPKGWRKEGVVRANGNGIFHARWGRPWKTGTFRAKLGTRVSPPFALAPTKERFFNPFGASCSG